MRHILPRAVMIAVALMLVLTASLNAQELIELQPGKSAAPFHSRLWYLVDDTGEMTIDDALAQPERFMRNHTEQINLGVMGAVIWLRLDVANVGAEPSEWLVNSLLRSAEILDIYQLQGGKTELLFSAANTAAVSAALQDYDMLAVKLSLAAGKRSTLMVRYHATNVTRLPIEITTFAAAAQAKQNNYVVFTIIAASVATFAAYSTAIFLLIGGRAILYYAIAEVAMVLLLANFDGILSLDFGQYTPAAKLVAPALFSGLSIIFTALFARNFFPLRTHAPRADLFMRFIYWAGLAYLAATGLTVAQPALFDRVQIVPYVLLAAIWLFLPLLAIYATARWRVSYWPLIPGQSSVLFAHGYWILLVHNLVAEPPFQPRLLGLNFIFQGFFMAIAIVLRVRQLRDDGLRAQLALNSALERQLDAARKDAAMLREMADQGRLVQAAVHDTRSILYGLRNIAATLRRDVDAARVAGAAQEIDYLTDDLEAVFSTTIAGAPSGGAEDVLAVEQVTIQQVLSTVRLIHEREARDKGLRFKVYAGPHELVTDRALLSRILGNLIDNAFHYTPHGGVIVAARRNAHTLRLQVWDSGCGIDAVLLARLLDPGAGQQRGPNDGAGQGSGLRIAKSLAARLGGTITACSRPGHGSRFELVLPLVADRSVPVSAKLWILDGDPFSARKLQAMAQSLGAVSTALSVPEFSQKIARNEIAATDLALFDLHFGGTMGGIQLAAQLAAKLPRKNIFICTYDRGVDVRAKLASVAGAILYQPVSLEMLHFAVNRTPRHAP